MKLASGGLSSRYGISYSRNRAPVAGKRRGTIAVLTAFLIIMLLAGVAFSVDVAYMQLVRNELRSNVDLAARAGTESILRTNNVTTARAAAKSIASKNKVAGAGMTLQDSDIIFGRTVRNNDGTMTFTANSTPYNSCQVNASRSASNSNGSVGLFFGPVFGVSNFQPQQTSTVIRGGRRRDIAVVADRSGSMDDTATGSRWGATKWDGLLDAFDVLKTALESTTDDTEQLGLSTFSTTATTDKYLTTNYASVVTSINSKWPNGSTNITDGINKALPILAGARTDADVEKVLVVMTDGLHNQGTGPMSLVSTINGLGYRVITITFGWDADQAGMADLAEACNGVHYHAPTNAELNTIFQNIGLGLDGLQYYQ